MIGLNFILIPIYGINGAAFATLLSTIMFNLIRFIFLLVKYGMHPFTHKTAWAILWVAVTAVLGYFMLSLKLHPIFNILAKSIIVSSIFAVGVWKLKLSEDINMIVDKALTFVKSKVSK
jgi:O-antigen/teichoic acid export membrane protein